MSSGKWRPFCLGLNVLGQYIQIIHSIHIGDELALLDYQIISRSNGWGTAGILQSTPPDWELQDRKWHLNSGVHKQKCLTLTTPALASWRPKNDVTMMCADLWRGYQRGLIIHYDAHARRFRKAQVISSSADLRWTHIGPRQEGLRGKVCEKVYHDKFINGRRDF